MPSREALSRLISIFSCGAAALLVARDVGQLRQRLQLLRGSAPSGRAPSLSTSTSVYWYWVLDSRPPILMSCAACMYSVTPQHRLQRLVQAARSPGQTAAVCVLCGFNVMNIRPSFSVDGGAAGPDIGADAATAGSFITTPTPRWMAAMPAGEIFCAASVMPRIRPVSCCGKKPFGISRTARRSPRRSRS